MRNYFYRGKLPHWQPPEGTFFITYRLFGSIPKTVIEQIKMEYKLSLKKAEHEAFLEVLPDFQLYGDFQKSKIGLSKEIQKKTNAIIRKKKNIASKMYFKNFDDFLDSNLNEPHWLKNPDIAALNYKNIQFYAEKYYDLWAFTIMSNHVHILLTLKPGAPMLWKVLQDMKKYFGRKSNVILGREGTFWENESYDHLVRDGEFNNILRYILNNPVKIGLVKDWKEWEWNYCHPDLL